MLTSAGAPPIIDDRPAYRPYTVRVARIRRLSPHFVRVTFTADDFDTFGTAGLDQRIKLVLPLPGIGCSHLRADDPEVIASGAWHAVWREQPAHLRNPFRTYTVRAVRPHERELDVDFVFHGDGGPAAQWLMQAAPGQELVIIGPDERSRWSRTGLDWRPGTATTMLLAGDETAAPAICSILESMPADRFAHAFVEVPSEEDALAIDIPDGCRITWLPRGDAPLGSKLDPAVRQWVAANRAAILPVMADEREDLDDIDVDLELLWDSPQTESTSDFYAWLAGEASVIKGLRRHLVTETGVDRKRVAFMGYWRMGKSEAQE